MIQMPSSSYLWNFIGFLDFFPIFFIEVIYLFIYFITTFLQVEEHYCFDSLEKQQHQRLYMHFYGGGIQNTIL
jgi:hypothetical protein